MLGRGATASPGRSGARRCVAFQARADCRSERRRAAIASPGARAAARSAARRSKSCCGKAPRQGSRGRRPRQAAELRQQIDEILAGLPNLPADEVPDGPDESANRMLRHHGEPPRFDFAPLSHEAIGERLGMMDFARAGKLSGSRFVVLHGALARLERALGSVHARPAHNEFGYAEVSPPLLVRDEAVFGTGQLPKFAEDLFRTTDGYWLIPTAEVPLTNLVAGEILDESRAAAALSPPGRRVSARRLARRARTPAV